MLLIADAIDPEVMLWLAARHPVRQAPELAGDPWALRNALRSARAAILAPSIALDAELLGQAPMLQAVGRLSGSVENIDLEACAQASVEVIRHDDATARAEAEFCIGAMLQLMRRVPVVNAEGLLVGRELSGATVGLVGLTPAGQPLTKLLRAFGSHVMGYDPALHGNDPLWKHWKIEAVSLRELMTQCDVVCVLLGYYSRYHGLLGERYLSQCRPNQVLVSISSVALFDEVALADVLATGRMAAAWFDSMSPEWMVRGRPLQQLDTVQVTPRLASLTREARIRAAWEVARRIDTLLEPPAIQPRSRSGVDGSHGLSGSSAGLGAAAGDNFRSTEPGVSAHAAHGADVMAVPGAAGASGGLRRAGPAGPGSAPLAQVVPHPQAAQAQGPAAARPPYPGQPAASMPAHGLVHTQAHPQAHPQARAQGQAPVHAHAHANAPAPVHGLVAPQQPPRAAAAGGLSASPTGARPGPSAATVSG